jgi:hypothetical protein
MDALNYILFGSFISFYLLFWLLRKKIKIQDSLFRVVTKIHYFVLISILIIIILIPFGLYFRGEWTNEIIMWIFLFSNFIIQFNVESLKTEFEKVYFKVILFSPLVLIVSWIIPMFGLLISYNFIFLFNHYEEIIYNDNELKFSYEEKLFNYHNEFLVYKKGYLFEKEIRYISRDEVDFEKITKAKLLNNHKIQIEFIESETKLKKEIILDLKKITI